MAFCVRSSRSFFASCAVAAAVPTLTARRSCKSAPGVGCVGKLPDDPVAQSLWFAAAGRAARDEQSVSRFAAIAPNFLLPWQRPGLAHAVETGAMSSFSIPEFDDEEEERKLKRRRGEDLDNEPEVVTAVGVGSTSVAPSTPEVPVDEVAVFASSFAEPVDEGAEVESDVTIFDDLMCNVYNNCTAPVSPPHEDDLFTIVEDGYSGPDVLPDDVDTLLQDEKFDTCPSTPPFSFPPSPPAVSCSVHPSSLSSIPVPVHPIHPPSDSAYCKINLREEFSDSLPLSYVSKTGDPALHPVVISESGKRIALKSRSSNR